MKNFLLAAVSGLAIISISEAMAENKDQQEANTPVVSAQPEHESQKHMVPQHAASPDAAPKHVVHKHATQKHAAHKHVAHKHEAHKHIAHKHEAHKHVAHKHHAHHHLHHHYHYYMGQPVEVYEMLRQDYRRYPVEYYGGQSTCPYRYHGGYFWYPHARDNMLRSYMPHAIEGRYWYPSRMHPHAVYVDRSPLIYTHPLRMDSVLYERQMHPMQRKWETAPDRMHMPQ
jgi:hypothetical protein